MLSEEVEKKYKDVQTVIEEALESTKTITLTGQEENVELSAIRKTLDSLNIEFKSEIDRLKNSSEWDKFCLAFFGETNAGKSTIIESLRIIYDEETRRAEAMAQKNGYNQLMAKHCEDYRNLISTLKAVNDSIKNEYDQLITKHHKNYQDLNSTSKTANTSGDRKIQNWIFCIISGIVGLTLGLIWASLRITI